MDEAFGPEKECPACDGTGVVGVDDVDCCGSYLDTGECCAALYGTSRLVQVVIPEPCPNCLGAGKVPVYGDEKE